MCAFCEFSELWGVRMLNKCVRMYRSNLCRKILSLNDWHKEFPLFFTLSTIQPRIAQIVYEGKKTNNCRLNFLTVLTTQCFVKDNQFVVLEKDDFINNLAAR